VKKWFIALLFVFACLPVVAVKAAPPQTYVHLDYEIINGDYNLGDGQFEGRPGWLCSNKIQIPKNVDKLYFSAWHTHFVLFFSDITYIGFYHEASYVNDYTFDPGAEEKELGVYYYGEDEEELILDVPTNAAYIVLQTCRDVTETGLDDYMDPIPIAFNPYVKPLIYYPAPADAATNITFNLMPTLMIMVVIAGLIGGLIMITKKSKR
jgi:hypothetical protein